MNSKKRLFILLSYIIFGSLAGFLLSNFWFMGGNTFWQPVDYFPQPVEQVLGMQPYGNEFWVMAADKNTYHILYPCLGTDPCWEQVDEVPAVAPSDTTTAGEGQCLNDYFVYPLFRKIKTCLTSTVFAENTPGSTSKSAGTPWVVSLALTDANQLWVWQKPWDFSSRILAFNIFLTFLGLLIGLIADTRFAGKIE